MDIQKFMDDRGYTQADLAEALGTSPQNVNNSLESIKRRIEK